MKGRGDLLDGAALVVIQIDGQAVLGLQAHDGLEQLAFGGVIGHRRVPLLIQRHGAAPPEGAQQAPALVHRHPQQPVLPVLLALKAVSLLVELEQDGLGHVLRVRPVLQSVVSNPVEHVPVGAGHPLECLFCHGYSLPCGRLLKGLSLRIPAGGGKYLRPGKKRGRNFPLGKSAPGLTGPDAGRP